MAGPGAFHILGAGSVGLLFAHHLRRAALPVTLLLRDGAAVERFRAQGNKITLESASKWVSCMPGCAGCSLLPSCSPVASR